MVSGTLIDVGCLITLAALARREGITLVDLLVIDRRHVVRELLLGLVLVLALVPRLDALTWHSLVAAAIVVVVWSQHIALPFVHDARYLMYRVLTTVPIAITAVVLSTLVLRRRLLPLVVVHWVADVLAALSPALFLGSQG